MGETENNFTPFSRFSGYSVRISKYYLDKCAVLEIETGKQVNGSEIKLRDDKETRKIEIEGYKSLVTLQLEKILNTKMITR